MSEVVAPPRPVLMALVRLVRPRAGLAALGAWAAVLVAATTAIYPLALQMLTTKLVDGHSGPSVALERWAWVLTTLDVDVERFAAAIDPYLVSGFVVVVVVKGLAHAGRVLAWGRLTQRVVYDLRARLFDHLVAQRPAFFVRHQVGDIAARFGRDVDDVERSIGQALPVLVGDTLKFLALAVVTIVQYPGLLQVGLAVFAGAALPIVGFGRLLRRYAGVGQRAQGALTQRVVEVVQGITLVQTSDAADSEKQKYAVTQDRYLGAMQRMLAVRAAHTPLMEVLGVAAIVLTLQVAAGRAETAVQPGEAVGFLLAMVLMYEPLKNVGRLNGVLMPGLSAAERLFALLTESTAIREPVRPQRWSATPSVAVYEGVGFRFAPAAPWVVRDLNLTLRRSRVTALIGPSGSGKTTAANLLPRLHDATEGRVTMQGIDIRDVALSTLRAQVAFVTQDTFLFHASVRDNIAYGLSGVSDDDVRRAARRAQAHEFIEALPEGYATPCGDRGVRLSGGQRQRIAIARAFLKNAPFVVLDEATSALDLAQERAVQTALDNLMDDRAVLVIAHRPSTVSMADEILVLERGRVVDRGPLTEIGAQNASPEATWCR